MRMRKLLAMLLVLLTLLCAAPALHADVIWEPYNNSFYDEVRDDCEYRNKAYTAQPGVEAYVDPREAYADPHPAQPDWTSDEACELFINFVYTFDDGTEWGCTDIQLNDEWTSLWVNLSTLTPVYDHRDFVSEHEGEIMSYNGELDAFAYDGEMLLWTYPGSSENYVLHADAYFETDYFNLLYTDKNGDVWAYIPYIEGFDGWVYTPDPGQVQPIDLSELPAVEPSEEPAAASVAPTATQKPANTPAPAATVEATLSRTTVLLIALAILAVLFVVILSAALIVVIFVLSKKKKKN